MQTPALQAVLPHGDLGKALERGEPEEPGFLSALPLSLGLSGIRRQVPAGCSAVDELGPWRLPSLLIQPSQQGTRVHVQPRAAVRVRDMLSSGVGPLGLRGTGTVLPVGMGREDVTGSALGAAGSVPALPREEAGPGAEPVCKACGWKPTAKVGGRTPACPARGRCSPARGNLPPHIGGGPVRTATGRACRSSQVTVWPGSRARRAGLRGSRCRGPAGIISSWPPQRLPKAEAPSRGARQHLCSPWSRTCP